MPRPGYAWWHLTLSTRGSWLPGDARGFRSRGHRIHCSGNYRQRPPRHEHAALHAYHRQRSRPAMVIAPHHRPGIGQAMLATLRRLDTRVLALAVSGMHAHVVIECLDDRAAAKRVAGKLKQASSHAVRKTMPGRIWADGGSFIRVHDRAHQIELRRYLLDHARQGAWTWSYENAT